MRTFILLILFFQFYKVESQNFCITPQNSTTPEPTTLTSKFQTYVPDSYYLRIYVHVIRRSDGTGGQTVNNVNEALGYLDMDFNSHNIYFQWDGSINYIDDDTQYGGPFFYATFFNNPLRTDGIDIFMYDDNATAGGSAFGVGENSALYVSGSFPNEPYDSLIKSHIISHEIGHVCFLWHTHRQKETSCQEYVDGSNSDVCGDFVYDTPPDPGLVYDVDYLTCQWNSSANDPNGVPYNPDETLIMSYTNPSCMSYFSLGQGERMRNSIENLPHLMDVIVDAGNCPTHLNIIKDVASGSTDTNHTYDSIKASNIIESGSTAEYKAGQEINLNSGFYAESGSTFTAEIEPCTASSSSSKQAKAKQSTTELVSKALENSLSVYPNPTTDVLNIACKELLNDITIYDITGKQIHAIKNINTKEAFVDMSRFNSGIYFLKIKMKTGEISTRKVIKK